MFELSDFCPNSGRIEWPHVNIKQMEKVQGEPDMQYTALER